MKAEVSAYSAQL